MVLREGFELVECVGEPHSSALLAAREPDAQEEGGEQICAELKGLLELPS